MLKLTSTLAYLFIFIASLGATPASTTFTSEADALLKAYVRSGRIDYAGLKANNALTPLVADIAAIDLSGLKGNDRKAFLINAYNLLVIHQALEHYPLKSVLDVKGFFDANRQTVGGQKVTLNQLEKEWLIKAFPDARLHFVLVCGANGCPPITNFAYQPDQLDAQLERQTRLALNDADFIRMKDTQVGLSQIFEWYANDFGGSTKKVLDFINTYRTEALPTDAKVSYYTYDWSLNRQLGRAASEIPNPGGVSAPPPTGGNNAARYVVSSTIPQGSAEIKIFNNLYSQEVAGERASFFTTTTSALYGVTNRFNFGFDLRYRRVRYDAAGTASNFDVFQNGGTFSRSAVTGFGPKVRIAPFNQLPNFSIQSAYWFPVADDPTGAASDGRFVDFAGATWFTQIFNDFSIGNNFSVFAEVDVTLEDIGSREAGRLNRLSTPVTGIVSYFPNPKTTLYGLASYAPFWQEDFDYFYQLGGGAKYQFTPKLELEVLLTAFDNQFISNNNGNAGTVNLGLRFNL